MKKIGSWIIMKILLPLLKDLLKQILIAVSKYFMDWIKERMKTWKEQDLKTAKNEEEKINIVNKWEDRIKDVENLKSTMSESLEKIVDNEILKSEEKVKSIEIKDETVKQISS